MQNPQIAGIMGKKNSRPSNRRQSALLLYDTVAHQAINVLYSLELSPVPTVWPIKSVRVNSPVLRRGAAVLFAKSGGLVPYSLAKALVKVLTKAARKLKNCTNNKEKRERIFHSLCFYPLP